MPAARPSAPRKAAAKPAKSAVATAAPAAAAPKLHYDKAALLADYQSTFHIFMKALAICVGSVLLYFLVFVVYLGGYSHTPHTPAFEQFKDRFEIEYDGLKLPFYPQQ